MLKFLDYDGTRTRFTVGNDYAILTVLPDGFCTLRSSLNADNFFNCSFGALDGAMDYIISMNFIDSLREE